MGARTRQHGFTLIELVLVIVLLGALAGITSLFIVQPFQSAADISRRAELVDEAELALGRIGREVRTALPNSVRVTDNAPGADRFAVEFVSTRTGGRYRRLPDSSGAGATLVPADSSGTFDVLGALPDAGIGGLVTGGGGSEDCARGNRDCISVYNTGQSGYDVYDEDNVDGDNRGGDNLAAITGTSGASPTGTITYDNGTGSPGTAAFQSHSPRQRFFVVDDVVSFVCDTSAGTLRRRATYGLISAQPISAGDFPGLANATNDLLARDVAACDFAYQPGDSSRAGLLTMTLTLQRDGEAVELLKQVHVMNAP